MQRLDDQYLMRQSEAPLLKRMPSEYMAVPIALHLPADGKSNMKALECTSPIIVMPNQIYFMRQTGPISILIRQA